MLKDRIQSDLTEAQKAKDEHRIAVLRMLNSALKNAHIEKRSKNPDKPELTEEEIIDVVGKEVKQRRDSIEEYRKGSRDDLADKEQAEIDVLQAYMPEQLPQEELDKLVQEAIDQTGASSPSDMGKVMAALMPKVKGKADGKAVSETAKRLLAS